MIGTAAGGARGSRASKPSQAPGEGPKVVEVKDGDDQVQVVNKTKGSRLSEEAKTRLAQMEMERKCIKCLSKWVFPSVERTLMICFALNG